MLDINDVSGSRVIETGYLPRVGVREAHAAAALEVMSRFALDPRWLLYLPPTMSPVATSTRDGLLEHPEQAFTAYHSDGVTDVLCEEKHMGSRAVLLICRTPATARTRFAAPAPAPAAPTTSPTPTTSVALPDPTASVTSSTPAAPATPADPCGAIWTRTGRPFFPAALTADLADRVRSAAEQAGLFSELDTGWLLLDAELLPWNAKAGQLLRDQYAAVGAAARAALPAAVAALEQAAARPLPAAAPALHALLDRTRARMTNADAFTAAYLRYCWSTDGLSGVRVAPFQLLASEGAVHHERPHSWHLEIADRLVAAAPDLIAPTRRLAVDTSDPASVATATRWWEDMTAAGGEGMVVKPAANLTRARRGSDSDQPRRGSDSDQPRRGSDSDQPRRGSDSDQPRRGSDSDQPRRGSDSDQPRRGSDSDQQSKGLVQPGLKVRGREYLRLIYGPDYTEPGNLDRLRQRALSHKRSLALREYALGLEALDRVARGEPLWRVHECVFAVLALESEPVDPRL